MAKIENRLGRGLGALIPENNIQTAPNVEEAIKNGTVAEIEIDKIETNPFQPRANFDEEALIELSESIKQLGIIQPITVRILSENKFQLISGERRLRASKMAGFTKIPAFVRKANDQEMLEFALVENIQREDLNPIEIAITFQRLIEECHLTQDQLSERTGKARSSIANYIRLLKLPPEVQAGVRSGKITMGHAKILTSLSERHLQLKVYYKILAGGLNIKQTQKEVDALLNPQKNKEETEITEIPNDIKELKTKFENYFELKSNLKISTNGKAKLVIDFEDTEKLKKLLNFFS